MNRNDKHDKMIARLILSLLILALISLMILAYS